MERSEVYKLIDDERDYQNQNPRHDDSAAHPSDWLIFIEKHLNKAKDRIYNLEPNNTMEQIRIIAALAVAAMENNLTRSRVK